VNDYADGFGPDRQSDVWDGDPLRVLRRGWPLLVAAVLILAGLGWGLGGLRASAYTSSVEIAVQPLPGAPLSAASRSSSQLTSAMNSEVESVSSDAVARAVSRMLGVHLDAAASAIGAHVVSNTNDLIVDFTGSTPALARRGAWVTAETFLQVRASAAQHRIAAQIRHAAAQLAVAERRLARAPTLRSQVIGYASQVEVFAPTMGELRSVAVEPGTVITLPSTPASAGMVKAAPYGVVGGALGLLVAACAVLWRSRHGPRVWYESLAAIGGCPVLAVLPDATRRDDLACANAYRLLRVAVLGQPDHVLAVSSVAPDHGSAEHVVAELERSLSGGRARVARLTADEVGPPAGPSLRAKLRELAATHDLVLAAGPPLESQDGEAFAVAARRVLLAVEDGVTSLRRCHETIARLRRHAVVVSGMLVLPRPPGEA
jgi:hypothetical protein